MNNKEDIIEQIQNEVEDDYSDDSLFNIVSWGADLSFREIISMYDDEELVKPELQRKYVWDKSEASRFIESVLMGLPVPSVFFAQTGSRKLIVDGYQRIMTVRDYVKGFFSADNKPFRLSNSEKINIRWRNKLFSELSVDDQRKIKSTTIHTIIFEQKKPENGDTSLYQVFERINTSGRTLTPQEIRNCVYQGSMNTLLFELNKNSKWRELYGLQTEDPRMRDLELILRFFLMKSDYVLNTDASQISLKQSLNLFMSKYAHADEKIINEFRQDFADTIDGVYKVLGINAFRNITNGKFTKKFHPAIFDAIMVAFYKAIRAGVEIRECSEDIHKEMLSNENFASFISMRTTNVENIKGRIDLAEKYLIMGSKE